MEAYDGQDSGWQLKGTWSLTASGAPSPVSVTPASGGGASQSFTFVFSDPRGYAAISSVSVIFAGSLSATNACYLFYARAANNVYLANDAATAWLSPVTPGQSGTVQNGQCSVNASASAVVGSGNILTLTLSLTFQQGFNGGKNVYMQITDGQDSGWQQRGSWTVNAAASLGPVSVTPAAGSGMSQKFTLVYMDPKGYASMLSASVIFAPALSAGGVCYLYYARSSNAIYLANDSGTAWLSPRILGQSGTVQNSQCTVDAAASSASGSGNNLTLNLALSFTSSFNGSKNVYMETYDGQDSGWAQKGTWTIQ